MLNAVDPKYKKWSIVSEELEYVAKNGGGTNKRNDNSMCLTHGFHHQATFSFRDPIRCVAYRSNAVREEFLVNHGTGPGNVFHLRKHHKTDQDFPMLATKASKKSNEVYSTRFPVHGPPQQHVVWVPNYRLFVAFGSDKNLRVFADTIHRCKVVSAPTVCAMPVLSMVYLDDTDEVVTGGIGVIQPWKIRLSTNLKSSQSDETTASGRVRRGSLKLHGGISQHKNTEGYGPGRQMLQALPPFSCNIHSDDWVFHMRVYRGKASISGGKQRLLIAVCHDGILAIDYMKRCQLWGVRLYDPQIKVLDGYDKSHKSDLPDEGLRSTKRNTMGKTYHVHGHVSLTRCDFFARFGYFVTGGGEGTIRIMHMVNFGLVHVLRGHLSSITGLIAHPIHPMLISASTDGSIRVWCLETFTMTQRIDTGQKIENIFLGADPSFIYFQSKQQVSLYRLTNVYSLYSVLHSSAVKLTRIEGVPEEGIAGKILASLEDGSVAVLSPLTGLLLTMIYPMTTFQTFTEMTFDPYYNFAYIKLSDGHVMQCNCSTNPSLPIRRYVPTLPYDQDVYSLTSVTLSLGRHDGITAVFAGLRDGQIALVHPNCLRFSTMQAHTGGVRFIGPIERGTDTSLTPEEVILRCKKNLISVGSSTIRTWRIVAETTRHIRHQHEPMLIRLEPELKIALPPCMADTAFLAVLRDRLCVCNSDNRIFVLVLKSAVYKNAPNRRTALKQTPQTVKDLARIRYGTSMFGNRSSITPINEADSLKMHPHDDDHASTVTSMESSTTLNCFVSSSDDGYVKIWDEDNRLVRELCFAPHHPTAVCFPNGRDLLVALRGRVCFVELSKFMTRQLIRDRRIYDLNFFDDINECAVPYDDDIRTTNNLYDLNEAPLEALERKHSPDLKPKSLLKAKHETPIVEIDAKISTLPVDDHVIKIVVTKADSTSSTASSDIWRKKWKLVISKVIKLNRKSRKQVIVEKEKTFPCGKQKAFGKDSKDFEDKTKNKEKANVEKIVNDEKNVVKKESNCYAKIVEYAGMFDGKIAKRILESKYPIAPDGYIQNSVIRQKVRPPTPKIKTIAEWKLRPVPHGDLPSHSSYDGSSLSSPSESHFTIDYESSDSFRLSDFSSLTSFPDFSDDQRAASRMTSPDIGNMSSLASRTQDDATRKVLFFQEVQEREELHDKDEKQRSDVSYIGKTSEKKQVPVRASKSDLTSSVATVQRQPPSSAIPSKRDDLKAKLKEQRLTAVIRASEKMSEIPKVLKDITSAPWFRKKLEEVTPDSVMYALVEQGDTCRLFAHEKAIENMLVLVQEYPVRAGGGEEYLSTQAISKAQKHLAKFLKPSYDVTNPHATHPNRVNLADNALDAIISGIPPNDLIQKELFRLLADDDDGLREKAKLILEVKFGIDSWEKLCDELSEMTGGGSVIPDPKERVQEEKIVIDVMKQRIENGDVSMASTPRLAERYGFEIIQPKSSSHQQVGRSSRRSSTSSVFGKSPTSLPSLRKSVTSRESFKQQIIEKVVQFKKPAQKEARRINRQRKSTAIDQPTPMKNDGVMEIVPRPKIPWRKAIPEKSLERRQIAGLIQMMQKLNLKSYEEVTPRKRSRDRLISRAESRLLPPIATKIFEPTRSEREESPGRDIRDRFPFIPSAARLSRESRKAEKSLLLRASRDQERPFMTSDSRDVVTSNSYVAPKSQSSTRQPPSTADLVDKTTTLSGSKTPPAILSSNTVETTLSESSINLSTTLTLDTEDQVLDKIERQPSLKSTNNLIKQEINTGDNNDLTSNIQQVTSDYQSNNYSTERISRGNESLIQDKPNYDSPNDVTENVQRLKSDHRVDDHSRSSLSYKPTTTSCQSLFDEYPRSDHLSNNVSTEHVTKSSRSLTGYTQNSQHSNRSFTSKQLTSSSSLLTTKIPSSDYFSDSISNEHITSSSQSLASNIHGGVHCMSSLNYLSQQSVKSLQRSSALRVLHKLNQTTKDYTMSDSSVLFRSQESLQRKFPSLDEVSKTLPHHLASHVNEVSSLFPGRLSEVQDSGFVEGGQDSNSNRDHSFPNQEYKPRGSVNSKALSKSSVAQGKGDVEDWRVIIKKLKEKRINDTSGNNNANKRKKDDAVNVAVKCQRKRNSESEAYATNRERIASHYSVLKDNRDLKIHPSRILRLMQKLKPDSKQQMAGESRYGIMSVHWMEGESHVTNSWTSSPAMTPCHQQDEEVPFHSTYLQHEYTSKAQMLPHEIDVSRGHRLSKLLNNALSKDRAQKMKVRKQQKLHESETKITTSRNGKTTLMLKLPSCEKLGRSSTGHADKNWGTSAPPTTPVTGF